MEIVVEDGLKTFNRLTFIIDIALLTLYHQSY